VILKDRASFFSFFLRSLYEVCLIQIKGAVSDKRSTVCTHRYDDCLLKNTSTKDNNYVVNQKLEHVDDISFRKPVGRVFQQTVVIPMGANCAPLLSDLFLFSYEADLIQGLLQKNEKKLARSLNFTFRYIDDVLSLNNYKKLEHVDDISFRKPVGRIRVVFNKIRYVPS
jgi:hypothetical protein